MKQNIGRIWNNTLKKYIQGEDILKCINLYGENCIYIEGKDENIFQKYACSLENTPIYEGDIIVLSNIIDEKDYYIVELSENGEFLASNDNESLPISEITKNYTLNNIETIINKLQLQQEHKEIFKNVCTNCFSQNIIIQPLGTSTFVCDKCGCLY